MKVEVKCCFCGEVFEVDFIIPPNDEEKEAGWICESCYEAFKDD